MADVAPGGGIPQRDPMNDPRGTRDFRDPHYGECLGCYGCCYRRVYGGAGCLPNCGNVVLRLTLCHVGRGYGWPGAVGLGKPDGAERTSC